MSIFELFGKKNKGTDKEVNSNSSAGKAEVVDFQAKALAREELNQSLEQEVEEVIGEYFSDDMVMDRETFSNQVKEYVKNLISDEKLSENGLSAEKIKAIYAIVIEEVKAGTILGAMEEYYMDKISLEDHLMDELSETNTSGGSGRDDPRNDREAWSKLG